MSGHLHRSGTVHSSGALAIESQRPPFRSAHRLNLGTQSYWLRTPGRTWIVPQKRGPCRSATSFQPKQVVQRGVDPALSKVVVVRAVLSSNPVPFVFPHDFNTVDRGPLSSIIPHWLEFEIC